MPITPVPSNRCIQTTPHQIGHTRELYKNTEVVADLAHLTEQRAVELAHAAKRCVLLWGVYCWYLCVCVGGHVPLTDVPLTDAGARGQAVRARLGSDVGMEWLGACLSFFRFRMWCVWCLDVWPLCIC